MAVHAARCSSIAALNAAADGRLLVTGPDRRIAAALAIGTPIANWACRVRQIDML
jgi:hypothetical protein